MKTYDELPISKIEKKANINHDVPENGKQKRDNKKSFGINLLHRFLVLLGALFLTFLFFMILPLMQTISQGPQTDLVLQSIDTANVPSPPPPPQEEPEQEEKQEEKPPELAEEAPLLDLSQLELALNPGMGFSEGWAGGDFAVKLNTVISSNGGSDMDELFSMADLDQQPRAIYQTGPTMNQQMRKKAPGTVYVLFIVDQNGRVESPMIQKSTDPIFEAPALTAVKQWKFEPGKRKGKSVRFRMRVPISFPKG